MARPLVVTITAGALLSACGLFTSEPPEPECCYNPPPPVWMMAGWDWDETAQDPSTSVVTTVASDGSSLVAMPGEGGTVVCVQPDGTARWTLALPDDADTAVVVEHQGAVLIVSYHSISSGAWVRRLDLKTGDMKWSHALAAMGPQDHSKYRNAVQAVWGDGAFVIRGKESAGRYVEVVSLDGDQRRYLIAEGARLNRDMLVAEDRGQVTVRGVVVTVGGVVVKGEPDKAGVAGKALHLLDGTPVVLNCDDQAAWTEGAQVEVTGALAHRPFTLSDCEQK